MEFGVFNGATWGKSNRIVACLCRYQRRLSLYNDCTRFLEVPFTCRTTKHIWQHRISDLISNIICIMRGCLCSFEFGCFTTKQWRYARDGEIYGNGEGFLFMFDSVQSVDSDQKSFKHFECTMENSIFQHLNHSGFGLGGGGQGFGVTMNP